MPLDVRAIGLAVGVPAGHNRMQRLEETLAHVQGLGYTLVELGISSLGIIFDGAVRAAPLADLAAVTRNFNLRYTVHGLNRLNLAYDPRHDLCRRIMRAQIEVAHAMNALVAISGFGVLLAVLHAEAPVAVRALTTTEWVVVTLAIGVVGGALFHLFLGDDPPEDRLVVALGGAVVLASGTAAHLGLSPTWATLTMGVVLVNSMRRPEALHRVVRQGERPLYFALLLLAGASWTAPPGLGWWLVFVHYLMVRVPAKLWGTAIATWWNGAQRAVGVDWGRALLGQGRLTLVLALDYARRGLPHGDVVFTCAAAAVLLTEFAAARLTRNVVDAFLPEGVR